jgi:hypothetical protein
VKGVLRYVQKVETPGFQHQAKKHVAKHRQKKSFKKKDDRKKDRFHSWKMNFGLRQISGFPEGRKIV